MKHTLLCLFCCAALTAVPAHADRVVHKERSVYQTILIVKRANEVCMQFSVRRDQRNQSCMDTRDPRRMLFTYTRMMMASLLLVDAPERVLMVGLGGGTLPTALHELYPEAVIDAVEIDPAVVRMAREYFNFKTNDKLRVFERDARVFTKRAALQGTKYDLILLDAYNGEYIPEHLMTREYLEETKAVLSDRGVLAANTFAVSDLYHHESATYAAVFGDFYNFKLWNSANRVVLARPSGLPKPQALRDRADALRQQLAPYNVPITRYLKNLDGRKDWRADARVLTDQFSPVNILNQQR